MAIKIIQIEKFRKIHLEVFCNKAILKMFGTITGKRQWCSCILLELQDESCNVSA